MTMLLRCVRAAAGSPWESRALSTRLGLGGPPNLRFLATEAATGGERERQLEDKLRTALGAEAVQVEDTSGGCGTMYQIVVASQRFAGESMVQQHRMVTAALEEEVKGWHGLTIRTLTPPKS